MGESITLYFLDQEGLRQYDSAIKEYIKQQIKLINTKSPDNQLNGTSTNSVQNKTIYNEFQRYWKELVKVDTKIAYSSTGVSINLMNGQGIGSLISINSNPIEYPNTAAGVDAIALGIDCKALNTRAVSIGNGNISAGNTSYTIGQSNKNWGNGTFVSGNGNIVGLQEQFDENGAPVGDINTQYSAIIGLNNTVRGQHLLVAGKGNRINTEGTLGHHIFVSGQSNKAINTNNSAIIGNNNTVGFNGATLNSIVVGLNNTYDGSTGAVFGSRNTVNGAWNFVAGAYNIVNFGGHYVIGQNLETYTNNGVTVLLGRYNRDTGIDAILQVGSGADPSTKKTAFEVKRAGGFVSYGDSDIQGKLTVTTAPTSNNDVVNKKYLDDSLKNLTKLINGLTDAQIQALNKFAQSLTAEE